MPVPEFYRFIRPALALLADGQTHHLRDVENTLADQFQLSAEDRQELIPSGRCTRVCDRTQWALTYLRQAKLVESAGRGISRITARGMDYLKTCSETIVVCRAVDGSAIRGHRSSTAASCQHLADAWKPDK